jgi:hypothetical protein
MQELIARGLTLLIAGCAGTDQPGTSALTKLSPLAF